MAAAATFGVGNLPPGRSASQPLGAPSLRFSLDAEGIRAGLEKIVNTYESKLNTLLCDVEGSASAPPGRRRFLATFGRLADADGHAALASAELTLPALVSGDAEVRAASSEAKKALQRLWAGTYSRVDVYERLSAAAADAETPEDRRFVGAVLGKFEQAGATVSDAKVRAEVSALDARCSALAFEIEQNINEDCTEVQLEEVELVGCDAAFIDSLPRPSGDAGTALSSSRLCSVKAPVLLPIMQRCDCEEARRKMLEASQRKCVEKNGPLLDELLCKRHEVALKLGFGSHADRMLAPKMAGSVKRAEEFCVKMLERLAPLRDIELSKLRDRKVLHKGRKRKLQADGEGAGDTDCPEESTCAFESWDVQYYSDLLKREELSIDDEKLKEYFPLESTIERMLDFYSEFLGLTFEKNASLPVWHEDVVAFDVRNEASTVVGHLYLDQFPRKGKFGHQMIVPLAPSFVDHSTGERCLPACVNISNLSRPQGEKPALLRFSEMQTLFHELGHAMHCLCTTTQYSILSWAWPMVPWPGGVEQDFLELPSMTLEKLATEPELLARVAHHYSNDPAVPALSDDVIGKIKSLERWMVGTSNTKYFAMALADLRLHARAPPYIIVDETTGAQELLTGKQLFARIVEESTKLIDIPGTHPCASWYHLVIGYDAGYYGYGWSDVYAADVFEVMRSSRGGALSAEVGAKLRQQILGPCASRSGDEMLHAFLEREPTVDAWCRFKGVPE
eukprot:TRINITY_DN13375_c0_g1_i1.p1 TRINITY_DN13375_c0_g1~~TRINITY_DN13375_c0_g1_i1.p1  ORF type:complete len:762 (-),score=126.38 TRINITY_DN13375_c0_g1_i1:107-2311(-)